MCDSDMLEHAAVEGAAGRLVVPLAEHTAKGLKGPAFMGRDG